MRVRRVVRMRLLNIAFKEGTGSESSDVCIATSLTRHVKPRVKYYGNDRKRGCPNTFCRRFSRAREQARLRTCNDRFRSEHELSIDGAGQRHCYCLRSSTALGFGIRVYEGSVARPSYGLRCIRILRFRVEPIGKPTQGLPKRAYMHNTHA